MLKNITRFTNSVKAKKFIGAVEASDITNLSKDHITDLDIGGYEFTGGFKDRLTGTSGISDIGSNVNYTSAMVAANQWYRFGFDANKQITNDQPYWGDGPDSSEAPHAGTNNYQGVGLFGGAYMPSGVTNLFDFTSNTVYNTSTSLNGLTMNNTTGSFDFSQCKVGDLAKIRFDFNVVPKFANTTIEVGLIWSTRDSNNNITFTFPLLTQPIFFGTGTVGNVYLNRPIVTAYFASSEDVNAKALLAIKSDNAIDIQPLTTLCTIER